MRAASFWVVTLLSMIAGCGDLGFGLGPPPSPPESPPPVRTGYSDADVGDMPHLVDGAHATDAEIDDATMADGSRDAGDSPEGGTAFWMVYKDILQRRCGCHSSPPLLGGLDMTTEATAYSSLVGSPPGNSPSRGSACIDTGRARVVPGNPGASLLWQKVQSFDDQLRCGARMPQGATPLSEEEVSMIADWIAEGANP